MSSGAGAATAVVPAWPLALALNSSTTSRSSFRSGVDQLVMSMVRLVPIMGSS
jgi:hypothetical protein